jgi:hypothetical protein
MLQPPYCSGLTSAGAPVTATAALGRKYETVFRPVMNLYGCTIPLMTRANREDGMRRKLIGALTAGLIMVAASLPVAAADQPVLTDQQRTDAIIHLNWLQAGTYNLPASNS